MNYEKKNSPRVICETYQDDDVTIAAIAQGYRFQKCGLRLTRTRNGKRAQSYASYIPIDKLRELIAKLQEEQSEKTLLFAQRDVLPANKCAFAPRGQGKDLTKTLLITTVTKDAAQIVSTVQWGDDKERSIGTVISLVELSDMARAMDYDYQAYELHAKTKSMGRSHNRRAKGVDICAA